MKKIKEKKFRFYIISVVLLVFVFLLNFDFAIAEFSYQPLSAVPETLVSGKVTNLGTYITGIYKVVIGLAIVLAVIMLIFAGLEWMTAGAVGKKEDAIKRINAALFGLLLTLGSWLFLNTVNPAAINFNLKLTEVNIVDTSAPVIGGYYCQSKKDGPYYGPYKSEESCVEKTDCVPTSVPGAGNRYCIKAGPDWKGGPAVGGINDEVLIDKFFDTGITVDDEFIKLNGPGLYFNVYSWGSSSEKRVKERVGPHKTAQECNDAKNKIVSDGAANEMGECYFVEWGVNDHLLNRMLEKEDDTRKSLDSGGIKVSTSEKTEKMCKYVGDTVCTNVGDLYVKTVVESLKNLKITCDKWAKDNEKGTCNITITGGTEWWHHGNGSLYIDDKFQKTNHKPYSYGSSFGRTVDLRLDSVLTAFIKEKYEEIHPNKEPTTTSLGERYDFFPPDYFVPGKYLEELKDGEANHWHVDFFH